MRFTPAIMQAAATSAETACRRIAGLARGTRQARLEPGTTPHHRDCLQDWFLLTLRRCPVCRSALPRKTAARREHLQQVCAERLGAGATRASCRAGATRAT